MVLGGIVNLVAAVPPRVELDGSVILICSFEIFKNIVYGPPVVPLPCGLSKYNGVHGKKN